MWVSFSTSKVAFCRSLVISGFMVAFRTANDICAGGEKSIITSVFYNLNLTSPLDSPASPRRRRRDESRDTHPEAATDCLTFTAPTILTSFDFRLI